MPYHRIPKSQIHEDITAIEREGEHVISVTADAEHFHVFTVYQGIETRALNAVTHAARTGVTA